MGFTPGTRIGPYEIVGAIGAGGMGEVYRARDTQLRRDVAIKVLPDQFAGDAERLARFEREARTLAALNHPHIAQVFGIAERALVMEFVDGEDLSQRIARSGALPVDEALPIALQIAQALEAAHAQGIVHRDLKPANIKVRPDGMVKVLDFGLAKALEAPDPGKTDPLRVTAENSPTVTSPSALSDLGLILGTAAYMAPEQARGKSVDKRADVWAFGCVLYEMLTARRAFQGENVTDTLAAIVRADPEWRALPADTPPAIRTLLRRCLQKDRGERLPDIGAARLELQDARAPESSHPAAAEAARPARRVMPWVIAGVATATAAALFAVMPRAAPESRVFKAHILTPAPLSGAPALRLAISPDGRRLAFVAPDPQGRTMLWVRALDSTDAQPLAGTANASAPFWSADSRSIAFIAEGKLRRIDASGGPVIVLCDAVDTPPGTWNRDDVIVFSGFRGPLARVSATGPGTPVLATELATASGEKIQILPWFLPDGRHFVYTAGASGTRAIGVYVGSLDTKRTELLIPAASNGAYANGYLLYLRETTLMAQRFDAGTLKLSGEAFPVASDVQINPATGTGAFSVSQAGVLVYQSGPSSGTLLNWLDRSGALVGTLSTRAGHRDVQLSPDGATASVTISADGTRQPDVWLFDLARGGLARRLTFGSHGSMGAVWSPDGRRLAYAARHKKWLDLYQRDASGTGGEEVLLEDHTDKVPLGFTPDGRFLLYEVSTRAASGHVWLLPMTGNRTPQPFNHTSEGEVPAQVSPDGRWIAYVSDESGRREVYVTSFPGATGKWQVSAAGGDNPRWRADGKEMFFTAADGLFAVDVDVTSARFDRGVVRRLFDVRVPAPALGTRSAYAVSRDGQRFLFNMWDPKTASAPITVVVNWPSTLPQ